MSSQDKIAWRSEPAPVQTVVEETQPPDFVKERYDRVLIAYVEHWFWRRGAAPRDPQSGSD